MSNGTSCLLTSYKWTQKEAWVSRFNTQVLRKTNIEKGNLKNGNRRRQSARTREGGDEMWAIGLNSWWNPREVPDADAQRDDSIILVVHLFLIKRWWYRGVCVIEYAKGAKSLKNISSSIHLWILFYIFSGCKEKMWKIVAVNGRVTWTVGSKFLLFNAVMGPIDPGKWKGKSLSRIRCEEEGSGSRHLSDCYGQFTRRINNRRTTDGALSTTQHFSFFIY